MGLPVEQISEDDVIIRQQQKDRALHLDDARPASFGEYLRLMGDRHATPRQRHRAAFESLAELAEMAKRAPRDG